MTKLTVASYCFAIVPKDCRLWYILMTINRRQYYYKDKS